MLLPNRPAIDHAGLESMQLRDQFGPHDPGLNGHQPARGVERRHAPECCQVDLPVVGAELLAAHRMPPPGEAEHRPARRRASHDTLHVLDRRWPEHTAYTGAVEL
ncbi:MAG: hypothetical protein R3B90_07865 [Planctomycetaceae bacterium]